jgi:dihydroorotate dehydrogenase
MSGAYALLRPCLFALDAETSHRLAIRALAAGLVPAPPPPDPRLRRSLLGLDFQNPLGIAAGFDKNGEVPAQLLKLGFGFAEIGTVTPLPQPGNPRPRIFRLPADRAVINRLGFNNDGHDAVYRRLSSHPHMGIVGVNVGANKDSPDRIADFVKGVARFAALASYLTVNVSSPNTPGLRDLQEKTALAALLASVLEARAAAARQPPLFLKIAPDLDDASLAAVAETALAAGIDGMILTNTTVARDRLADRRAAEAGGLSGRPLFHRSTVLLAKARRMVGNRMVLVGVGGVDSAETAFAKILAGADLVQLYTGMIYEGPGLPGRILAGLPALMAARGFSSVAAAVGRDAADWASHLVR